MRAAALIFVLTAAACAEEGAGGLGAPTPAAFEPVDAGTEPAGPQTDPSLILARDRAEAEVAASNAPAEGAAELLRSWDGFGDRALLVVYGGTVPDGGTSVRVDEVAVDGRSLVAVATLVSEDPAIQVVSTAWAAVAVDADVAASAETCALRLGGREIPDAACSPTIPYASK